MSDSGFVPTPSRSRARATPQPSLRRTRRLSRRLEGVSRLKEREGPGCRLRASGGSRSARGQPGEAQPTPTDRGLGVEVLVGGSPRFRKDGVLHPEGGRPRAGRTAPTGSPRDDGKNGSLRDSCRSMSNRRLDQEKAGSGSPTPCASTTTLYDGGVEAAGLGAGVRATRPVGAHRVSVDFRPPGCSASEPCPSRVSGSATPVRDGRHEGPLRPGGGSGVGRVRRRSLPSQGRPSSFVGGGGVCAGAGRSLSFGPKGVGGAGDVGGSPWTPVPLDREVTCGLPRSWRLLVSGRGVGGSSWGVV